MNLATIPAHVPFLDEVASRWLRLHGGSPGEGMILLPTRRAARSLAEAFLRVSGGRPMLLPRITAIGALDEAPLALSGALDLPPAIDPMERRAHLARLVLGLPEAQGGVRAADRAWRLAGELATLMDEAEWAEIDLPGGLTNAADAAHAEHWEVTVRFLAIVTRAWPDFLAAQALMNPVARQVKLLRAQAASWRDAAPDMPVWAAGMTAGFPAVAALLGAIARLPRGVVVFPGIDLAMRADIWDELRPGYSQAGLRTLLEALGARRTEAQVWNEVPAIAPPARDAAVATALLPAPALPAWRDQRGADMAGVSRMVPADTQEEAVAIALALRDAIAVPGERAALVTPDRSLAGRVASELLRWGIVADDSAGESLAETPPAVFLRLLAQAVASELAPVALLGVLKHPFAACGLSTAQCRDAARALERKALRGPRPPPGLTGLRQKLDQKAGEIGGRLLDAFERCVAPMLRTEAAAIAVRPEAQLAALVEAAEALATTDEAGGPARLWAHEEGEALAALLSAAIAAARHLPDQHPRHLPGLLDAMLEGEVVRSRRALRGRGVVAEHPRVFIWGMLEARLQSVDLAILGGLVDDVWPPATDPGPWMSREMRDRAGLPDPEARVGQAAHDFHAVLSGSKRAILSCPRRRDGAPAVPSRFLVRLEAYLAGQHTILPAHPATEWARQLDQPAGPTRPVDPPAPRPPAQNRPVRLSVTAIETLIADPYAIYARHILGLKKLRPLEEPTDHADYGTLVHAAIHSFIQQIGAAWPADARERLAERMDVTLKELRLRAALEEWWAPRLQRIAGWIAETEIKRRSNAAPAVIRTEADGVLTLPDAAFTLTGRADRIERRHDGSLAILDYKTGTPPSAREVENGHAPQLPLEALMAREGAFGPELTGPTGELIYWHLTGGYEPGHAVALFKSDAERIAAHLDEAHAALVDLLRKFALAETPYLSQPHPGRRPRFSDYAQLARAAEWDSVDEPP